MQLQLNGSANLSAGPQAFSAGLANATYIPGTGLQYGGAAPHLQQQRASLPTRASDVSSLQQDPNALAAAAAAAANAAAYKRNAGLPPHVAQQLLRGQQVLPNQAGPRPPNGLLFETNDIDLSGEPYCNLLWCMMCHKHPEASLRICLGRICSCCSHSCLCQWLDAAANCCVTLMMIFHGTVWSHIFTGIVIGIAVHISLQLFPSQNVPTLPAICLWHQLI